MNPSLQKQAQLLQKKLQKLDRQKLNQELRLQLQSRLNNFASALKLFNDCSYKRDEANVPRLWEEGSTSLLDYSISSSDQPVIFVPSLINKSYIFDLSKDKSLLRYMAQNGLRPFLVDWGEPHDEELSFGLEDYISGRLSKIISKVISLTGKPVILAGYCMGGLLACSAALENEGKVKGLICMATPWDFHVPEFPRIGISSQSLNSLKKLSGSSDRVSANILQSFFYYLHPELLKQKFANLASVTSVDESIAEVLAIEYWVNDGISITKNVWKECFVDWVHYNKTAKGKWKIGGKAVDPSKIQIEALFIIPNNDKIVPKNCALPLASLVKNSKLIQPDCGHVGIVAGKHSKELVWDPMLDWVKRVA